MARVRLPGSWTTVGNLDATARGAVDATGRVAVDGCGWVLDWWIGAEDRWHQPSREAAVRQQLVGASPVVETRVRIPSGDAVARTYGARGPRGEDLLVLEVENDSQAPVALALVVSPHEHGHLTDLALAGTAIHVDGTVLHVARSPGRIALSTAADERDAGEVVLAGDAEPVRRAEVSCAHGQAQGVLLFPLAHRATLRTAIVLDGATRAIDPATLPTARQVASGWATHSRGGSRIEVPDRRLREAVAASARFLLLEGERAPVAEALDLLGFADEAWTRLQAVDLLDEPGASLSAIATHWSLRPDPAFARAVVPSVAALVPALGQARSDGDAARGRAALPALAALLDHAGEPRAAQDVRAIPTGPPPPPPSLDDLVDAVAPADRAALIRAVRAHLVDDAGDGLALSPVVPEPWLGQGWEVHDLPTAFGRLSFAIRWHGDRPALLWELMAHPGSGPVRLTTPGLDPAWSSTEAAGEALLGPVPVPDRPSRRRGLSIPVTIEPIRRRA
jgi:hypothetical protein